MSYTSGKEIIPEYNTLTFISKLGGSTGAELYQDNSGKKWVIKKGSTKENYSQIYYEYIANTIYTACNILTPSCMLDTVNKVLILQYIEGKELGQFKKNSSNEEFLKVKYKIQSGFIIDALLANWDVIGLNMDNIIVENKTNNVYRIDNGGAFLFKASGGYKPFNANVFELYTLRDKNINPQAAIIFGDMTYNTISDSIVNNILYKENNILNMIATSLPIYNIIKERINYLKLWKLYYIDTIEGNPFLRSIKTESPEYIQSFIQTLINIFINQNKRDNKYKGKNKSKNINSRLESDFIDSFNNILITNNAIITSDIFLDPSNYSKINELIIFVPSKNAYNFTKTIVNIFNPNNIQYNTNKNRLSINNKSIISITKLLRNIPINSNITIYEYVDNINHKTLIYNNIQLSINKNWYDGKMCYTLYQSDIISKHAYVSNTYYLELFIKDDALIDYIKKYINMGFSIYYKDPSKYKFYSKSIIYDDITNDIKNNTFLKEYESISVYYKSLYDTIDNPVVITSNIDEINAYSSFNNIPISDSSLVLNTKNIPSKYNIAYSERILTLFNKSSLSEWEYSIIHFYTHDDFHNINLFLYNSKYNPTKLNDIAIYTILYEKFIKKGNKDINKRIMYYYCANLYNSIQKTLDNKNTIPFAVIRGVNKLYLMTDTTKFYYLNGFSSTTTDSSVVSSFGSTNRYIFYVHPLCQYMNISALSELSEKEKEIILNPYNRYYFIKKTNEKITYEGESNPRNITNYIFAVLPTDLTIPSTFEEFMKWKSDVSQLGVNKVGGRLNSLRINNNTTRKNNNFTIKPINYKKSNIKNTMKNKMNTFKNTMNTVNNIMNTNINSNSITNYDNNFINRISEPIASFSGKAPTDAEKKVIDWMVSYFENKNI